MSIKLSSAKVEHLNALSDERGVIAAAAMDQRGSLQGSIAAAKGIEKGAVTDKMMSEFKTAVSAVLTPHASAILLDPQCGLPAAAAREEGTGLLLSYEASGYDNTRPGRRADLLPTLSARRILELGGNAVKILIYYTPFEDQAVNDEKHAFVERIGSECADVGIPFFLEFIGYDPAGGNEKGFEFAKKKPQVVIESMKEFSKDRYQVDVLKVEVPVNLAFAEGAGVYKGEKAYSKGQALDIYREAAEVASRPFIYLSAGVSNDQFTESLRWAAEAGTAFAGVLCGRATWKEGIPVYGEKGPAALEEWLRGDGVRNIGAVNSCLEQAQPWWSTYGTSSPQDLVA